MVKHLYQFNNAAIKTWCCGIIYNVPTRFTCVAESEEEAKKKIAESFTINGFYFGEPTIDAHKNI